MSMKSRDWNEGLSKRLKDLSYASDFLLALIEEGGSLQEALAHTIEGYGVREFANLVDLDEAAIQRNINSNYNPTKNTLEKLLAPFGLYLAARRPDKVEIKSPLPVSINH